jgi:hypothetical protein
MTIYETDTNKMLTYTTATTSWVPSWNLPWGIVGTSSATSTFTIPLTTPTDITGLSVTATLVKNRQYRAQWVAPVLKDATASRAILQLVVNGLTVARTQTDITAAGRQTPNGIFTFGLGVTTTPSGIVSASGSYVFKVQGYCAAGTATLDVAVDQPAILLIEDIGPASSPA